MLGNVGGKESTVYCVVMIQSCAIIVHTAQHAGSCCCVLLTLPKYLLRATFSNPCTPCVRLQQQGMLAIGAALLGSPCMVPSAYTMTCCNMHRNFVT